MTVISDTRRADLFTRLNTYAERLWDFEPDDDRSELKVRVATMPMPDVLTLLHASEFLEQVWAVGQPTDVCCAECLNECVEVADRPAAAGAMHMLHHVLFEVYGWPDDDDEDEDGS